MPRTPKRFQTKPRNRGPVVVNRSGKTFLRKRPRKGIVYLNRNRYTGSEIAKLRKLQYQSVAASTVTQLGHHNAFYSNNRNAQILGSGAYVAGSMAQYDVAAHQRKIANSARQRQLKTIKGFEKSKVHDHFWHGAVTTSKGKTYKVRHKHFYNKPRWNK